MLKVFYKCKLLHTLEALSYAQQYSLSFIEDKNQTKQPNNNNKQKQKTLDFNINREVKKNLGAYMQALFRP